MPEATTLSNALSLTSALLAASATVLARSLLRNTSGRDLLGPNFLIIALMMLPAAPFALHFVWTERAALLLASVIAIDAFANLALFEAIRRARFVGSVQPALSLVPAFSVLAAVVFFPADLSPDRVIASGIVVGGIYYLQLLDDRRNLVPPSPAATDGAGRGQFVGPAVMAVASAAAFGVSANLSKLLLQGGNPDTNPYSLYLLRAIGIAAIGLLVSRPKRDVLPPIRKIGARGIFVIGQWLAFLTALQSGNIVVVITLANLTPIFVLVLAGVFLREAITRRAVGVAAVAVVGAILVAVV